ncbi:MAG: outer membrane lipoprotein-sorting protein [Candidatus Aminicenantes bacterium]|nr:outer membrane lipoprotein-sorting protein [Candidatus Aminicenantes bacterium]
METHKKQKKGLPGPWGLSWSWIFAGIIIFFLLLLLALWAVQVFPAQGLSADEILKRVDEVVNAPKDREARIKVIIIDSRGKQEIREMLSYQKGSDRRLVKFTSPAEHRGIGFLSLPNEVMYLYLPAYGRTRRIASHVKNTKFAGTDFTYEDMEALRYSEKWSGQWLREEDGNYVLELRPKGETKTQYSKMVMWIRRENFYPAKVELYDRANRLSKLLSLDKVEKIGQYWVSRQMTMEDLKEKRKTILELEEIKFDVGLADEIFTERFLMR